MRVELLSLLAVLTAGDDHNEAIIKATIDNVYRQQEPGIAARIWQRVHPCDVVLTSQDAIQAGEINPRSHPL